VWGVISPSGVKITPERDSEKSQGETRVDKNHHGLRETEYIQHLSPFFIALPENPRDF
jgi:hypothetical protein